MLCNRSGGTELRLNALDVEATYNLELADTLPDGAIKGALRSPNQEKAAD